MVGLRSQIGIVGLRPQIGRLVRIRAYSHRAQRPLGWLADARHLAAFRQAAFRMSFS